MMSMLLESHGLKAQEVASMWHCVEELNTLVN